VAGKSAQVCDRTIALADIPNLVNRDREAAGIGEWEYRVAIDALKDLKLIASSVAALGPAVAGIALTALGHEFLETCAVDGGYKPRP
jgi:hypothetical protein